MAEWHSKVISAETSHPSVGFPPHRGPSALPPSYFLRHLLSDRVTALDTQATEDRISTTRTLRTLNGAETPGTITSHGLFISSCFCLEVK